MREERGLRPGDPRPGTGTEHTVFIANREQVQIYGVASVTSFDDQEIVLDTEMGTLTIRGEELHIKQLDLESGRFAVEGSVTSLVYSERLARGSGRARSRGILERLLK